MKRITWGHQGQRIFYGWLVAMACFVLLFMGYGLTNGPFSLYMIPVTQGLGLTRTQFAAVQSIRCVVVASVNLVFGLLASRLTLRRLLIIGSSGWVLSFVLFATAQGYLSFFLGGMCLGLGFALSSTAVISGLVKNWFHAHRGLIMGVIFAGTGLGSSLFSVIVERWIATLGWRASYGLCAGLLLLCAGAAIAVVRNQPSELGLLPYGEAPDQPHSEPEKSGVTLRQALREPVFYLVMAAMFLNGFLNNPIYVVVPALIVDAGYTAVFSARVISVFFISVACCKVLLGYSYDRLGLLNTLRFSLTANSLGILCLLLARAPWWYYTFAVIFGISLPLETVLMPLIAASVFGEKEYPTFVGLGLSLASAGMAVGNPLLNSFYDRLGTYQGILLIFFGLSLLLWLLLNYALTRKPLY